MQEVERPGAQAARASANAPVSHAELRHRVATGGAVEAAEYQAEPGRGEAVFDASGIPVSGRTP